ncbi:MAG: tRNA adenosine(34) deaminase TadA [Emergencia sp.]
MNSLMKEALAEAEKAFRMGEVPVGAVIEKDGQIIARGHNLTETLKDPTAHAEMIALREAARVLGGWRLPGCSLYVTVEPCCMCAGAMIWARIDHLYIGAMDPKAGACGSVFDITGSDRLNHRIAVETGIMEEECRQLMREFFVRLRNRKKNNKSEESHK